jgi:hypothetical protein
VQRITDIVQKPWYKGKNNHDSLRIFRCDAPHSLTPSQRAIRNGEVKAEEM